MKKTKSPISERRVSRNIRAAVAFADMRGSLVWSQRVNNQGREYSKLMNIFDSMICDLKIVYDYYKKRLGDGFMAILNLPQESSLQLAEFLLVLWMLKEKMDQEIRIHPNPRPGLIRVRIACGYMEEKLHRDGDVDYRGYHIGMTAKLLRVEKSVPFICHQSIKEILTQTHIRQFRFQFKKLPRPKVIPEGIFKEDADELYSFRILKPRSKEKKKV